MTLTEFILARVAEDEVAARWPSADWVEPYEEPLRWHLDSRDGPDMLVVHPAHVLRQCEAIRTIVALYGPIQFGESYDGSMVPLGGDGPETYWDAVCALASIWADHPDYQTEWAE